jgi:uncharacterized protein YndB with AHSA1/START domain
METLINESYGKIIAPGVILFQRILPGSKEKVWSYLTESDKRAKWLASGHAGNKKGDDIRLEFYHEKLSEEKELNSGSCNDSKGGSGFTGKITAYDPPILLSFTWGEEDDNHSEVTFELNSHGDKTMLTLTHRRLPSNQLVSVASGWHTHLGILLDVLEGKSPKGFWKVHNQMEQEYQTRV